jgi:hypothetical protein
LITKISLRFHHGMALMPWRSRRNGLWNLSFLRRRSTRAGFVGMLVFTVPLQSSAGIDGA